MSSLQGLCIHRSYSDMMDRAKGPELNINNRIRFSEKNCLAHSVEILLNVDGG